MGIKYKIVKSIEASVVIHAYNPSTQNEKSGFPGLEGQPELQTPCLKAKRPKNI